jgi:hypothetical protein
MWWFVQEAIHEIGHHDFWLVVPALGSVFEPRNALTLDRSMQHCLQF